MAARVLGNPDAVERRHRRDGSPAWLSLAVGSWRYGRVAGKLVEREQGSEAESCCFAPQARMDPFAARPSPAAAPPAPDSNPFSAQPPPQQLQPDAAQPQPAPQPQQPPAYSQAPAAAPVSSVGSGAFAAGVAARSAAGSAAGSAPASPSSQVGSSAAPGSTSPHVHAQTSSHSCGELRRQFWSCLQRQYARDWQVSRPELT